ncbi:hypothetical protein GMA3_99 [Gordonia phage GMA3]|uniref:Uncharacterized protein n=1 Tax=Gordonia phage GMA3 TaxID=1647284 RepID=A0A0K0NKN6_9CAUD|nr:hypothetical protein AU105_gp099 [Gordonia phage GMA3]AKL88276.1 hypothetical protein GMA3_99 [Gordonia phage GMA3]
MKFEGMPSGANAVFTLSTGQKIFADDWQYDDENKWILVCQEKRMSTCLNVDHIVAFNFVHKNYCPPVGHIVASENGEPPHFYGT